MTDKQEFDQLIRQALKIGAIDSCAAVGGKFDFRIGSSSFVALPENAMALLQAIIGWHESEHWVRSSYPGLTQPADVATRRSRPSAS